MEQIKKEQVEQWKQEKWALKTNLDDALDLIDAYKKRVSELESQIEKMKRCDMCKYSTRLGYCKIRQHGGVCENRNKWEIKEE